MLLNISAEIFQKMATQAAAFHIVAEKFEIDTSFFLDLAQKTIDNNGGQIQIEGQTIAIPQKQVKYRIFSLKVRKNGSFTVPR